MSRAGNGTDSVAIDVTLSPNAVLPGFVKRSSGSGSGGSGSGCLPRCGWVAAEAWAFAKEDAASRVAFAFKAGLAMLLVSLLALVGEPFRLLGNNAVWSILTVGMFEYTVGATFNRGFNRAVGSVIAGVVALVVIRVALVSGSVAEPYVIGLSIFLVGAVTSFVKQLPALVPYECGFRVILFTFCLITVSCYRVDNPISAALYRLYSVAIGAALALLVNVLVFPAWAGEQLHRELVGSFAVVADTLDDCVRRYLNDDELITNDGLSDEPAIEKCRATLNASARIDSLASSAKWEPPHGRFRSFFFPWSHYVRVGAVLRHCAYEVVAMHGRLHSEIQAPHSIREVFRQEIQETAAQAAELVRFLGSNVDGMMVHSFERLSLLKSAHGPAYRLQLSLELNSHLLTSTPMMEPSNRTLGRSCSHNEGVRRQKRRLRSLDQVDELEKDTAAEMATSICNCLGDGKYNVYFDKHSILTTLTNSGDVVDECLDSIYRIHRRRLDHLVVGLDVEWRPSMARGVAPGPIALLQICVGRRCLVFQILHADYLPESLFDFFADERFNFFGVGIHDDVDKLSDHYDLEVENAVDLRYLAANRLDKPELKSAGLQAVVREVMGVWLEKPHNVRVSAWDAPRLSKQQLQHACVDAFASFEVGRRLCNGDY